MAPGLHRLIAFRVRLSGKAAPMLARHRCAVPRRPWKFATWSPGPSGLESLEPRVLLDAAGPALFPGPQSAVGSYPQAAFAGDLNGDGHMDMLTANAGSGSVSVLLNGGDGTFAPAVDYATGLFPSALAAGDLNGDGRADLATTNYGNTVSVFLSSADGALQPRLDFAVGVHPSAVAAADLDGDLDVDLAVANQDGNDVWVLPNGRARMAGDANRDGMVDVGDLGILGANYGKASGATWATADFTGDGAVDVGDLGVLGANYGQGMAAPAAVEAPPLDLAALALNVPATPDNGPQAGSIVIEQAPRMAADIAAVQLIHASLFDDVGEFVPASAPFSPQRGRWCLTQGAAGGAADPRALGNELLENKPHRGAGTVRDATGATGLEIPFPLIPGLESSFAGFIALGYKPAPSVRA